MSQQPHPVAGLDDVVHQRIRLGILSILAETDKADFSYLKTALQLSDGNLSRHIDVLAGQNLVTVHKGYHGKRPRTWVTISRDGRAAYAAEIAALRRLVDRFEQHGGDTGAAPHLPNAEATDTRPGHPPER